MSPLFQCGNTPSKAAMLACSSSVNSVEITHSRSAVSVAIALHGLSVGTRLCEAASYAVGDARSTRAAVAEAWRREGLKLTNGSADGRYDTIVIGSGASGLTCALRLAQAG